MNYKIKSKTAPTIQGTDCDGCKLYPCSYQRMMGLNKYLPLGVCGDKEEEEVIKYYCPKCKGYTYGAKFCGNPYCPDQPE